MKKICGFTLVELMVVLTVIGAAAVGGGARLRRPREARRGGGAQGKPGGDARCARQALRRRRQVSALARGAGGEALPARDPAPILSRSRPAPGSRCRRTIRRRAGCTTCAAARRAMSAGRTEQGFTLAGALIVIGAARRRPGRLRRDRLARRAAREGAGAALRRQPVQAGDRRLLRAHARRGEALPAEAGRSARGQAPSDAAAAPAQALRRSDHRQARVGPGRRARGRHHGRATACRRAKPIKSGGFLTRDSAFSEATGYSDWQFIHMPLIPAGRRARSPADRGIHKVFHVHGEQRARAGLNGAVLLPASDAATGVAPRRLRNSSGRLRPRRARRAQPRAVVGPAGSGVAPRSRC